jgi:hypothetical protein
MMVLGSDERIASKRHCGRLGYMAHSNAMEGMQRVCQSHDAFRYAAREKLHI